MYDRIGSTRTTNGDSLLGCVLFEGRKKKEALDTGLIKSIEESISEHIQTDPSFKTQTCYVKVTAGYVLKELVLKKGYPLGSFCKRTIGNMLDRLGYKLKKVLKTKPLKRIPQTDAIFGNVAKQHAAAKCDEKVLRISIDVKAKVKIGNLSRGGYSRLQKAPKADDHDHKWDAVLVPFGIYELNTDNVFITFGNSCETADFIVDALEKWWLERQFMKDEYHTLMIDLDNGQSVASTTKRFMGRIVAFSKQINMPIQLVYYPPYHSKYNPVERVWAALENYWKPLILNTVDSALKIAEQMTWKGFNPIVSFIDKIYPLGATLSSDDFNELKPFIRRNPNLAKWDVRILNALSG